jgi:2OG-Fe(II) oxygenase superfamily
MTGVRRRQTLAAVTSTTELAAHNGRFPMTADPLSNHSAAARVTPAGPVLRLVEDDVPEQATPEILVRSALQAGDVLAVAEGRALAIVIPGYYSGDQCKALAGRLLAARDLWKNYPKGSGAEHIGTLGSALYNCIGDELSADCQEYFNTAVERNRALRAVISPWVHPADRVRIELDNEWPAGATLLRIGGRPSFYGLCRFVRSGGGIEPHTDRADWDLPCIETATFQAQLFLNIYLTQAAAGGDLELWDMALPEKSDYDVLRSAKYSYALDRDRLPNPTATISIDPGALVIANASKPHAVTPCSGQGQRLSVSGFLGYSGPDVPLRAFS